MLPTIGSVPPCIVRELLREKTLREESYRFSSYLPEEGDVVV